MYNYKTVRYTIKDMYVQGSMKDKLDYKTYCKIWTMFADKAFEGLIDEGRTLKMPKGVGSLTINKSPSKRRQMIDYKKTRELGMVVYHNNYHSDNYYAFFNWETYSPGKAIFKFRPIRQRSRYLAYCIKHNNAINTYFEKK